MAHSDRPSSSQPLESPDLSVSLGRLRLPNPIMVASGTFGYGREMVGFVALERLGGIVPKTITLLPRQGNAPWRTVETASGLLNSIGLDNDGVEAFLKNQLPWLRQCRAPVIVSIAGASQPDFVQIADQLEGVPGIVALELNISCPNVSHGVDLGTDPEMCRSVVAGVRGVTKLPVLAKLTPNVTDIVAIAKGARDGGADGLTLINTCQGIAIDWRRRRPMLGNVIGGLSGPAIKPIALRCVYQVRQAIDIPIIGVGGILSIDDCMEFFVAGACAVQIGTANFADPVVSMNLLDALPKAFAEIGASCMADVVGTLLTPVRAASQPAGNPPHAS
ncbi:MAG: dihydroorotate dehydrogenase [Planctomycetia bacterium]|nr:dihydroorotate dehydrogenase [Planctomycetia bacterium]RLT15360.1 MAG: dihydroorotate dehydrogenase [Planctomycetota bacterium]